MIHDFQRFLVVCVVYVALLCRLLSMSIMQPITCACTLHTNARACIVLSSIRRRASSSSSYERFTRCRCIHSIKYFMLNIMQTCLCWCCRCCWCCCCFSCCKRSACTIHLKAERSSNSTSLFCCYYIAYALFFSNNIECIAYKQVGFFLPVSLRLLHSWSKASVGMLSVQRLIGIVTLKHQAKDHDKIVYIGASHTGSEPMPHGHRKSRAKLACDAMMMMMVRFYRQCMLCMRLYAYIWNLVGYRSPYPLYS